jgi:hypothetical protein
MILSGFVDCSLSSFSPCVEDVLCGFGDYGMRNCVGKERSPPIIFWKISHCFSKDTNYSNKLYKKHTMMKVCNEFKR